MLTICPKMGIISAIETSVKLKSALNRQKKAFFFWPLFGIVMFKNRVKLG